VRDIPLSVQSYTSSFMKAIETATVADLYSYIVGVSRAGGSGLDFTIRGFTAGPNGRANILYNGLPGLAARFGSPLTENVERIEVLKGPSSVLYGQVQPGGSINIITKKPQAERAAILDVRGGSYFGQGVGFGDDKTYHLATDLTGPVDAKRTLLYRLVAAYHEDQSFRDFVDNSQWYVVPSFSWLGWQGGVMTVELEYRRTRASVDNGLVAPNNDIRLVAPITVRYQEPGDWLHEDGKTATLFVKKSFANGVNWNLSWRSVFHDDDTKTYFSLSSALTTLTRRDNRIANSRRYHFLDTTVHKAIRTGPVRHGLLFGLNGGYELLDTDRRQFVSSPSLAVDLYHPIYGAPGLPPRPDVHTRLISHDYAAYVSDQLDFSPKWKGLVGLRQDRQDSTQRELRINPASLSQKTSDALLPLVGLVFQPDRVWSLYGSFSNSFQPPLLTAVDAKGENSFDPERGRQLEVGAKTELRNGRGDVTLALYQIKKDNVLNTVAPGISAQIGQQTSRGGELSVRLQPLANWQFIGGYAYTDSFVSKSVDPKQVGAAPVNTARHAANLWTRYDLTSGRLRRLGFGLGLVYSSDRAGSLPASTSPVPILRLPGYFRVDGGLYYVGARYEVTLRVVNLFDELYYESAFNPVQIQPGAPRSTTLSLRVRP
jgi:iron complex outermembrane receptor protein